jgi:hypothetical protein
MSTAVLHPGQFHLFDYEDYEGQSGNRVVSPRRKQETAEFQMQQQQQQFNWRHQYKRD